LLGSWEQFQFTLSNLQSKVNATALAENQCQKKPRGKYEDRLMAAAVRGERKRKPVAGFGHFSPRLRLKYTRFPSVIKDNSLYRLIPFLTLLVSVLVSVGVRAKWAKKNQRHDSQYEEPSGDTLGRALSLLGHLIFNVSPPGVFHPPELVNRGSYAEDPFRIIAQFLQGDAGEVLDGIGGRIAQRFEQAFGYQDRNVVRSATEDIRRFACA
jgi:hypothetical protein